MREPPGTPGPERPLRAFDYAGPCGWRKRAAPAVSLERNRCRADDSSVGAELLNDRWSAGKARCARKRSDGRGQDRLVTSWRSWHPSRLLGWEVHEPAVAPGHGQPAA